MRNRLAEIREREKQIEAEIHRRELADLFVNFQLRINRKRRLWETVRVSDGKVLDRGALDSRKVA